MSKKIIFLLIIGGILIAFYFFIIVPSNQKEKEQAEQNKIIAEPQVAIKEEYFRGYRKSDTTHKEENYAFPKDEETGKYIIRLGTYTIPKTTSSLGSEYDKPEQKFQSYHFDDSSDPIIGHHMIKKSYTFYGLNLDKTKVEDFNKIIDLQKLEERFKYIQHSFKSWQDVGGFWYDNTNSEINKHFKIHRDEGILNNKDKKTKLTKTSDSNDYLTLEYEGPKDLIETDKEYHIGRVQGFVTTNSVRGIMKSFDSVLSNSLIVDVYFNPVKNYLTLYKTKKQLQAEAEKTQS